MTKSLRAHYRRLEGEERLKRYIFRRFLKTVSDGAEVTFCGRVFHSRETATGKCWSSMIERRVRRTTSDDNKAERRRRRASTKHVTVAHPGSSPVSSQPPYKEKLGLSGHFLNKQTCIFPIKFWYV